MQKKYSAIEEARSFLQQVIPSVKILGAFLDLYQSLYQELSAQNSQATQTQILELQCTTMKNIMQYINSLKLLPQLDNLVEKLNQEIMK